MNICSAIDFLLGIPLFDSFQKAELYTILEKESLIQNFQSDEVIYLQNEKAYTMDIILEGEVNIQNINPKGDILSIVNLECEDMLGGNLNFSYTNEYPMTIIAKTDVKLFIIRKQTILELCQKNEDFLVSLLSMFSDKTLVLTNKIHSLSRKTIREKVFDFLHFEVNKQKSNTIVLSLSKKELSDKFGVERPSLQRELAKMRKEGLIKYDSRTITLLS